MAWHEYVFKVFNHSRFFPFHQQPGLCMRREKVQRGKTT